MATPNQVLVTSDPTSNLLECVFVGDIGPAEYARFEVALEQALVPLSAGFHLLIDLTHLDSMDLRLVPAVGKAMDLYRSRGVARVVRIIPDPSKDIGLGIMSIFHYPRGLKIITCENRTEALRALA